MDMTEEVFKPGDAVPRGGIYNVVHYQHRMPHDAVLTDAQPFPLCHVCGARVRYRLVRSGEPIEDDHDFKAGAA